MPQFLTMLEHRREPVAEVAKHTRLVSDTSLAPSSVSSVDRQEAFRSGDCAPGLSPTPDQVHAEWRVHETHTVGTTLFFLLPYAYYSITNN